LGYSFIELDFEYAFYTPYSEQQHPPVVQHPTVQHAVAMAVQQTIAAMLEEAPAVWQVLLAPVAQQVPAPVLQVLTPVAQQKEAPVVQ
jgi:hypothetical protein